MDGYTLIVINRLFGCQQIDIICSLDDIASWSLKSGQFNEWLEITWPGVTAGSFLAWRFWVCKQVRFGVRDGAGPSVRMQFD